jgi:hypothetical protein
MKLRNFVLNCGSHEPNFVFLVANLMVDLIDLSPNGTKFMKTISTTQWKHLSSYSMLVLMNFRFLTSNVR